MAHPLDGCTARLNRADVHIRKLEKLVLDFVREVPPPYGYEVVPDPDLSTFEFDLIGRVTKEPPHAEFGAVVGDVVNNLRAALDNLVWALTELHAGPAPAGWLPTGDRWRKVRFPILWESAKWGPKPPHDKGLWGVRPGLHARFHDLQPFVTGQHTGKPLQEPLAVLDELWSIDKHRHLHLGQWFMGLHDVSSGFKDFWGPDVPEGWEYEIIERFVPRPFQDRTPLGRVRVLQREVVGPDPWVYVKPQFAFDVAFEQGHPAYGGRLVETLRGLHQTTSAIVAQFESEFT